MSILGLTDLGRNNNLAVFLLCTASYRQQASPANKLQESTFRENLVRTKLSPHEPLLEGCGLLHISISAKVISVWFASLQ